VFFDFVKNSGGTRCYWHTEEKGFSTDNNIDQYYKTNTCPTTLNTGQTDGPCVPLFSELRDTGSVGGVKNDNLKDVAACKQYCNDEKDCVGFDFDAKKPDSPCFFFVDLGKLENSAFTRTGIMQYRISKRCEPRKSAVIA
jgi:hypothetical protein